MPTNGKTTRRRVLASSGGLIGISSLAGCTGSGGGDGGSTGGGGTKEITVVTELSNDGVMRAYDQWAEAFNERTGHTVNTEVVDEDLQATADRIRGGNAPEVSLLASSSIGSFLPDDVLAPVSDVYQDANLDIPERYRIIEGGETYSLPLSLAPYVHTVRKDLLSQVGYDLDYETDDPYNLTWEDHLDFSSKIDEQTDVKGTVVAVAETSLGTAYGITEGWTNDVNFFEVNNGDIEVVLDKGNNLSRMVEVLEYQKKLYEHSPESTGWSWGENLNAFVSGNAAGVKYPVGRVYQTARDNNPEIQPQVIPIRSPHNRIPDNGAFTYGFLKALCVFDTDTTETDLGLEYLKAVLDTPEGLVNYYVGAPFHALPLEAYPEAQEMWENHEEIKARPDIRQFEAGMLDQLRHFAIMDDGTFNPLGGLAYSTGAGSIPIQEAVIKGTDPEEAVKIGAKALRDLA